MRKPMTRKADKPLFPTTLDMLRPAAFQNVPCMHLVCEHAGMRFYLGTFATYPECTAAMKSYAAKTQFHRVAWYVVDRAATHFISGGETEFLAELAKGPRK